MEGFLCWSFRQSKLSVEDSLVSLTLRPAFLYEVKRPNSFRYDNRRYLVVNDLQIRLKLLMTTIWFRQWTKGNNYINIYIFLSKSVLNYLKSKHYFWWGIPFCVAFPIWIQNSLMILLFFIKLFFYFQTLLWFECHLHWIIQVTISDHVFCSK